jgi:glutamate-1-semialdehyde aminotransferase
MLSEGVHLFHGSGFLSTAHGEREAEVTISALRAALSQLQAEGLV